ncbi:MAG: Nif3-like dinuclear metal center hexameric protein [Caldilineae bacterium]|nr:Nif3-like dinuclear metal center hexameric protein [Chloroflexota bacterium]MCB9175823.1 Nif3-like dinuclear metal center hexameric protein [Caldilineae bacterium]
MQRDELVAYLDEQLQIADLADYGPQGLQVEGRTELRRVVASVDAGLPCVEAALDRGADLLLVHHGILWGPARRLVGGYGRLVRRLLDAELNLYAAHLALDAHPVWGNNAEICRLLGLELEGWWGLAKGRPIGARARAPEGCTLERLLQGVEAALGPTQLVQPHGPARIQRVAVMSGGGSGYIEEAAAQGCQAFITGETSQSAYYEALNAGIHVIYAGHYASETVGVKALGRHLAERFDLSFAFVDLPTGV